MGRGRGRGESREVLLGKRKISSHLDYIKTVKDDHVTKTFVDAKGNRIIRSYEDRENPVEIDKSLRSNTELTTYAYRETLDYDPQGDSIVVKKVLTTDGFKSITSFYSDEEQMIIRKPEHKDDPVFVEATNDLVTKEIFQWREGEDDYKKVITIHPGSKKKTVGTSLNGKAHGFNGEAAIKIFNTKGKILEEEFFYNGSPESVDDQPSYIAYNSEGPTLQKSWKNSSGELHRDESKGPAFQSFNLSGQLVKEEYWKEGKRHRENGPAAIGYIPDYEIFYLQGEQVSETQFNIRIAEGKY